MQGYARTTADERCMVLHAGESQGWHHEVPAAAGRQPCCGNGRNPLGRCRQAAPYRLCLVTGILPALTEPQILPPVLACYGLANRPAGPGPIHGQRVQSVAEPLV